MRGNGKHMCRYIMFEDRNARHMCGYFMSANRNGEHICAYFMYNHEMLRIPSGW